MWHTSWLILLMLISIALLVVACSAVVTRTPTLPMTTTPVMTLMLVGTAQPYPSETYADTPSPRRTWLPPTIDDGPPNPVHIEPPACYDQPDQTLLCLGRIVNDSDQTVIADRIAFAEPAASYASTTRPASQPTAIARPDIIVSQRTIVAGGFTVYRYTVAADAADDDVSSFDMAYHTVRRTRQTLSIRQQRVLADATDGAPYRVAVSLSNTDETTSHPSRIHATLLDAQGFVAAYRIIEIDPLAPRDLIDLTIELVPLSRFAPYTHVLTPE